MPLTNGQRKTPGDGRFLFDAPVVDQFRLSVCFWKQRQIEEGAFLACYKRLDSEELR